MPIPHLQPDGFLPPGLHLADMNEIEQRFGLATLQRQALLGRLRHFVDLADHTQARRLFVNGSYVTAKPDPGDVDVVIWVDEHFLQLLEVEDERALSLETMFLTRQPKEAFAVSDEKGWQNWVEFFSQVRYRDDLRKGLVEVKLR